MWLTILAIIFSCIYITFLFQRNKYFYIHSFFLIPLYPAIFFIDHNAHFVIRNMETDSVYPVVKLLPLYLNMFYLAVRFRINNNDLTPTFVIINIYLIYNVIISIVYSFYYVSILPFFYISYSIPAFFLYFNSTNFSEEVVDIRVSVAIDKKILNIYFVGFIIIYVAGVYYSIKSGITTSLLNSRSVGSIYASTSALVYCFLYAPLLSSITGKKWPHFLTVFIGLTSLSKTALLMLPAYSMLMLARIKTNIIRNLPKYLVGAIVLLALMPLLASTPLGEYWQAKFALDSGQNLLSKSYLTRGEIHDTAFKAIREFPFGIGVGNFEKYSDSGYHDAHNFMINILVESGVIFGSLMILIFCSCFLKTFKELFNGTFDFNHFSFVCIFAVYVTASGVLQTTGTSELTPIYYTPFYGVVVFQLLNTFRSNRLKQ